MRRCKLAVVQLTCGTSGGVEGKHGLDGDVHGGGVEGLKHDLCHLFSVQQYNRSGRYLRASSPI